MGFFSSRKDDSDTSVSSTPKKEDKSVVQVIRSRFHGKKGKERESPQVSFSRAHPSPLSIASSPSASNKNSYRNFISVPSFRRTTVDRTVPPLRLSYERIQPHEPIPHQSSKPSPLARQPSCSSSVQTRTTDSVTVTLAQRLDELASANSEGLLSDDEYRLLRQSLFERYASNAVVPSEAPILPVPSTIASNSETLTSRRISSLPIDRPASIISRSSGSEAHNLVRQTTERQAYLKDKGDASSFMSTRSNTSLFKRLLSRKASGSSIRTTASRVQTDAISISSRRISSDKGHGEVSFSPSTPRSTAGSIRRMPAPPSSFNARLVSQSRHSAIYDVFDENHLSTVRDIQQEIANVESEQRRLADAFSGLEISTLTRRRRIPPYTRSIEFSKATDSVWGDSDGRSQRRDLTDDGMSLRSGTSVKTSPSMARSTYGLRTKLSISSPMGNPLLNNASLSSFHDRRTPVPVPSLISGSHGYLHAANNSNVSLHSSRGGIHMGDEEKPWSADFGESLEGELDDIHRKREEVNHRYEARLEYLRAKLKGAQLHEKIMRR